MVDRLLRQRILAHGPVSVADFMQEVLTAPIGGYYTEAAASEGRADDPHSPAPGGAEGGPWSYYVFRRQMENVVFTLFIAMLFIMFIAMFPTMFFYRATP